MKTLESTAPFHTEIGGVLVSARGLQKSFHGRTIMRNVDFDMHAGDITVIIGKSGSGKSTMLRASPVSPSPTREPSTSTASASSRTSSAPRRGRTRAFTSAWCSRRTPSGRT